MLRRWARHVAIAVRRARDPLVWVALAYAVGVSAGVIAVHAGSPFALHERDRIVGHAVAHDAPSQALARGERVSAALFDFAGNLGRGAVPYTIMGLGVVIPLPLVVYQGWVGGIVSVDGHHASRFGSAREALYYCGVILLQLIPYSLAAATGIRLGLAFVMPKGRYGYPDSARWFGLPSEGVRDVFRVYTLVVPLFLVASFVEFLFG
jgi:plasmid stabilization system protein ParE